MLKFLGQVNSQSHGTPSCPIIRSLFGLFWLSKVNGTLWGVTFAALFLDQSPDFFQGGAVDGGDLVVGGGGQGADLGFVTGDFIPVRGQGFQARQELSAALGHAFGLFHDGLGQFFNSLQVKNEQIKRIFICHLPAQRVRSGPYNHCCDERDFTFSAEALAMHPVVDGVSVGCERGHAVRRGAI
jgi:hypothetical protein